MIRDTSVPKDDHYCLTCFVGGAPGIAWSRLPAHERRAQVLAQVAAIYGNAEEAYKPIEVFEQEWSKEEYSKVSRLVSVDLACYVFGKGVLSFFQPVELRRHVS